MSKVLVTGGAGYIGAHTVHLLLQQGYGVVVVDDLSRGYRHNVPPGLLREMSLADTGGVARVLAEEKVDAVIHFAAYIAVGESTRKPELYFSNNTGGSISLFSAMAQENVKKLVFSSTAAVYGVPAKVPISEDQPFAPINPYGETKVTVERILACLDAHSGLRSVSLRYFNACGADPEAGLGEEHDPETHLIPLVLRAVMTGEPVTIFGNDYPTPDGTPIRDYIHVNDLAQAHIAAVEHLMAGGESEAFNCGTGTGHTVMEVVRAAEDVAGTKVPRVIGPRREGDPPALVANSDKLRRRLGWQPRYPGLREMVETAFRWEQSRRRAGEQP